MCSAHPQQPYLNPDSAMMIYDFKPILSSSNFTITFTQMLGLAGFNSQQAAAAGLAGGRNPFTQQVHIFKWNWKYSWLRSSINCLPFYPLRLNTRQP